MKTSVLHSHGPGTRPPGWPPKTISPGSFCLFPKLFNHISFHWIYFLIVYISWYNISSLSLCTCTHTRTSWPLASWHHSALTWGCPRHQFPYATCHRPALSSPFGTLPWAAPTHPPTPADHNSTGLYLCSLWLIVLPRRVSLYSLHSSFLIKSHGLWLGSTAHCSPAVTGSLGQLIQTHR